MSTALHLRLRFEVVLGQNQVGSCHAINEKPDGQIPKLLIRAKPQRQPPILQSRIRRPSEGDIFAFDVARCAMHDKRASAQGNFHGETQIKNLTCSVVSLDGLSLFSAPS